MKIIDFLICDDVRQEVGNKFTLVGVYDSDIRIQTRTPEKLVWPLPVNLALYSKIQLESADEGLDGFEIAITHNGNELAKIQGTLAISHRDKPIPFSARMPSFPLPGEGLLKFHLLFSYKGKSLYDADAPKAMNISVEKTAAA